MPLSALIGFHAVLSYRHAFHAGNFADVHKHTALLLGIESLQRKQPAFCVIDAYAGAGEYDLGDRMAAKTAEWRNGIGKLLDASDPPEALQPYLRLVRAGNTQDGAPARYPGSPALAAASLRNQDRLVCLELHPNDYDQLARRFARNRQVHVHRRDAREGLPALLPPPERRGLVLVDPPYERAAEYEEVPMILMRSHARWPRGSYLAWYPLLAHDPHRAMLDALATSGIRKILVNELLAFPDAPGLRGSGLLWINPPWGLETVLQATAGWLARDFGGAYASAHTRWQVPE